MEQKNHFTAIVLAAGSGSRMHSEVPKQYMQVGGFPLLYYSLRAFSDSPVDDIVLVTDKTDYCAKEIVEKYKIRRVRAIVSGGAERYLSVREGLKAAADADYVLIHDGARPLLSGELIRAAMDGVVEAQACIPAVPVKDTIKVADGQGYVKETPPRDSLWAVQTPQCFSRGLLEKAYERLSAGEYPPVTDDAMLVEETIGQKAKLFPGDYRNIKVTTPEDIRLAEFFLQDLSGGESSCNIAPRHL